MKAIIYLNGGLGNQMFQYAAGRAWTLINSAELVLDNWSGFCRDYQYRRRYELGDFGVQARLAKPLERLPIWLHRWVCRGRKQTPILIENTWYGCFITETGFFYNPAFANKEVNCDAWLFGYWQSSKYFDSYAQQIRKELMPPKPSDDHFITLGDQIINSESVAICIRLYEESKEPGAHARGGVVNSTQSIRKAIERFNRLRPRAKYFVFCTHHSPMLDQVGLPKGTVFVTNDEKYIGTVETLWLLSRCCHHIITNSSFYWWGAWLSKEIRGRDQQIIFASDKFINRDSICSEWGQF